MAALQVAVALWGSSFVVMKALLAGLPAEFLVLARLATATACLLALCGPKRIWRLRRHREHLLALAAMGVCEPFLYFVFETKALALASAGQTAMVSATLPLFVALAAHRFLGEPLGRGQGAGLLLALAGCLWLPLAAGAQTHGPAPLAGALFELMAMVAATGYILLSRRLVPCLGALTVTTAQHMVGTLCCAAWFAWRHGADWPDLTPARIVGIMYLGCLVSAGAYGAYNYALARMPCGEAGLFLNLVPVWSVVLAGVFLGERLRPGQWLAAGLVLAGVTVGQVLYWIQEKRQRD